MNTCLVYGCEQEVVCGTDKIREKGYCEGHKHMLSDEHFNPFMDTLHDGELIEKIDHFKETKTHIIIFTKKDMIIGEFKGVKNKIVSLNWCWAGGLALTG